MSAVDDRELHWRTEDMTSEKENTDTLRAD